MTAQKKKTVVTLGHVRLSRVTLDWPGFNWSSFLTFLSAGLLHLKSKTISTEGVKEVDPIYPYSIDQECCT